MEFNSILSSIEELKVESCPLEIQEQFYDFINNVPFIRALIKKDRPRAKDLPKDESGRIIIDISNPHILEDMDYFRPTAINFLKTGLLCNYRPNPNPNSEFGKWVREEIKRIYEGYVRPSDGEWISGDYYWFLNYCPILMAKSDGSGSKKASRVIDFPDVWEGHYYKFHYLNMARNNGKHAGELSRRGCGKSFCGASLLSKRFVVGESYAVNRKVQCVATASERKYLSGANLILDMFLSYIDFVAVNAGKFFPSKRLINASLNLLWIMGYLDKDSGTKKGTLNSVIGVTSKDDESKLRGSRGVLYLIEEAGTFPRLLTLFNILRPSVEDGDKVFGMLYLYGTSGDSDSDFSAMLELMYNPIGYNIQDLPNIYDKEGLGRLRFTYFFPGYLNRANCYDSNGNSNVTKALLEILKDRYIVKYNSTDINSITKRVSEIPITPLEAIIRTRGNIFPVTELNDRINLIDNNPHEYDDVYTGTLSMEKNGTVIFKPTSDIPIRDFPLKDNKAKGAVEIFKMPEKNNEGKVFPGRYILSFDPVDQDASDSMSLASIFVLDLWTDKIVAEYTGRQDFAEDNYEILRKMCLFYNGRCLYENNLKGTFAYFSRMNCLYLLADVPEYLKDKDMIKGNKIGNLSKGVTATKPINDYANTLIRNWLLTPITKIEVVDGEELLIEVYNLYGIRSRALLKELALFNPDINVDRVRSLGLLMLYREEKMITYQGNLDRSNIDKEKTYLGNDPFFTNNYNNKLGKIPRINFK